MARGRGNPYAGILALVVFVIFGLVTYWYITLPLLVVIGLIWYANKSTTPTPPTPVVSEPKWREPYTQTYTPRKRRSSRPRKPRTSKPKPDPNNITFG